MAKKQKIVLQGNKKPIITEQDKDEVFHVPFLPSPDLSEVTYVNQENEVVTKSTKKVKVKGVKVEFTKNKCLGTCKGNPKSTHKTIIPSTSCSFDTEICDECYTVINANPI